MRRNSEEGPPRLAWGMYKRFVLAGVIITLACARRTIASAVLLEVDTGDRDLQAQHDADRPAGQGSCWPTSRRASPQTILVIGDDRRKVEALQKHPPPTRSDTMILRAPGPRRAAPPR